MNILGTKIDGYCIALVLIILFFIYVDNDNVENYSNFAPMDNSEYNVEIKSESLPLGDIIFEKDKNEIIMIERKTWKDLAASIRDGRYNEQSFRLNECDIHNHNIIYLIEKE